jgi:hypothetical protein
MSVELEEALDLLYKGQTNVALIAKETGITLEEMQCLFKEYVSQHPIDPDVWQGDVDLSWPWS